MFPEEASVVPTYLSRSTIPGRIEVLAELATCLVLAAILFGLSWAANTPGEVGAGAAGLGLAIAGACFAFQSNRKLLRLSRALDGAGRSTQAARSALESSHLQIIEVMARALDARDPYTAGHSIRVGAYSRAIALQMGLPVHEAEIIRIAAELHDIGKIGMPDVLLQKPGPLTDEEFGLVKLHPQVGRKILERVKSFENLLPVVELHHENHDGTGYPYRLIGDQIPLGVRIVHVADAFDAMVTHRPYRTARSFESAVDELIRCSGTQFDPQVVEAFLERIREHGPGEIVFPGGVVEIPAGPVELVAVAVAVELRRSEPGSHRNQD